MTWVVKDKSTGKALYETSNERLTKRLDKQLYEIQPIKDYLYELNQKLNGKTYREKVEA